MTTVPGLPPAGPPAADEDDTGRWREAARLRREHPKWVIIWLAPIRQLPQVRDLLSRQESVIEAGTQSDG